MSDLEVTFHDLSAELGVSITDLRRWAGAGFIPRHAPGRTRLFAALAGIIAAVRAEAADQTPYRPAPSTLPDGAILLVDADALMDRAAARFDAALAEAIEFVDAHISSVALINRSAFLIGEGTRSHLYETRREVAELPATARGLIRQWKAKR